MTPWAEEVTWCWRVKHAGVFKGLPSSQGIGGRPKKRGCQARLHCITPLRQPIQLAEGVEFPEKNADSRVFEPSFGGGGP